MRKIERWTRQDSKRKKKGEVKKRDKRGQGKTERRKKERAGKKTVKGHQPNFIYHTLTQ